MWEWVQASKHAKSWKWIRNLDGTWWNCSAGKNDFYPYSIMWDKFDIILIMLILYDIVGNFCRSCYASQVRELSWFMNEFFKGQLQTSISIKLLPRRWWIASQHWIAMDIPCRWESTQHPSRSWHLHPIQQARSLLVHHLFGKVSKAVKHRETWNKIGLWKSAEICLTFFSRLVPIKK